MDINKNYLYLIHLFVLIFLPGWSSLAQTNKYLVTFKDKSSSPYSISDPSPYLSQKAIDRRTKQNISLSIQDIPVNPNYVQAIRDLGVQVIFSTKWLNGVLVYADPAQIVSINQLTFVKSSNKASRKTNTESTKHSDVNLSTAALSMDYGSSSNQLTMLGIDQMHAENIHGQGLTIAIIDGGFLNAHTLPIFDSLRTFNRIIATYDFVENEVNVYDDHEHGTQVLSLLGGYSSGSLIGSVWKAKYLLLRSEDASPESISEEINWIRAAEYADSAGADIINSSLGYNTFDDATTDHTYSDLDGNTTWITQAADIAASKGILVVNSAGNYGNSTWKYILAPADGDSVLTVGAVQADGSYAALSSIGPTSDGRIKPDVSAQGNSVIIASPFGGTTVGNGTSFSGPLVAGLAAGLWQAYPELSSMELLNLIRKSGSQYSTPDNLMGYGIPNYGDAKTILLANNNELVSENIGSIYVSPNPVDNEPLVLNLSQNQTGKQIFIKFATILGKVMAEEIISSSETRNHFTTNMHGWPQGVYIIDVAIGDSHQILKFLKK